MAVTEDVKAVLEDIGRHFESKPLTLPHDAGYLAKLLTDNFRIDNRITQ